MGKEDRWSFCDIVEEYLYSSEGASVTENGNFQLTVSIGNWKMSYQFDPHQLDRMNPEIRKMFIKEKIDELYRAVLNGGNNDN